MSKSGWRRLHPVSPVVKAGRAAIALAILILPSALGGRSLSESYVQLGIVGVLGLLGFVSWFVTRWCIDGDDLRIETGLIRRQSLRFPLAQVQAIDVVRPGLARMFRVAELRLRVGIAAEAIFGALITTAIVSPGTASAVAGGGTGAYILAAGTLVWRRFNQEYRLTLAEAHDGLRLRSGLIALTAATTRPGRVQAVRMVEPLLWRLLGWCRAEG